MGERKRELTEAERVDATRRSRRRLGCTLLAFACGLALPEVLMRWLLFGSGELAASYGAELRDPGRFADPLLDTEFWTLRHELGLDKRVQRTNNRHPVLSWRPQGLDPVTLRHPDEPSLDGRRPILLYGASYAACVTRRDQCFQALVASSDLREEFRLLNYGCGGYGYDQVLLLMRETLDLYAHLDPVVVVLPVLDSDFERCSLDYRVLPKPRFALVDDELRLASTPSSPDPEEYLREHGTGITSYAWRYLVHADTQLPPWVRHKLTAKAERSAEQRALIEALLAAVEEELVRRDLDHVYVLATSPRGLPPKEVPEMETFVVATLRELGAHHVLVRDYVARALEHDGVDMERLFFQEDPGLNHPTPLGNRVVFEAMRDGLDACLGRAGAAEAAGD